MSSVICTAVFEVLQREPFQFSGTDLLGSQPEALIVFDRQICLQVSSRDRGKKSIHIRTVILTLYNSKSEQKSDE